ncbi:MAG: thermonuclease family protein [Candidatus Obscuribacterales bacterium]|nr:thermonuclease family protein [Candidatus Obscuribacterales bacterium]
MTTKLSRLAKVGLVLSLIAAPIGAFVLGKRLKDNSLKTCKAKGLATNEGEQKVTSKVAHNGTADDGFRSLTRSERRSFVRYVLKNKSNFATELSYMLQVGRTNSTQKTLAPDSSSTSEIPPLSQEEPAAATERKNYLLEGFIEIEASPDGDSGHFRADNPEDWKQLEREATTTARAVKVRINKNGTVQLRIEGIDSPELHYQHLAQALAKWSRDVFLKMLGVKKVSYDSNDIVTFAEPKRIKAFIVSAGPDKYGRPISYLFLGRPSQELVDKIKANGGYLKDNEVPIRESINNLLLKVGAAYITQYDNSPAEHRAALVEAATEAYEMEAGVYKEDATAQFTLNGQDSIGPEGALIVPKLFRRISNYNAVIEARQLIAKAATFVAPVARLFRAPLNVEAMEMASKMSFPDWLRSTSSDPRQDQDDWVYVDGSKTRVRLSSLCEHEGTTFRFKADMRKLVFSQSA